MSKLVNLSDTVYAELTRMKRLRDESYSEVIAGLLIAKGSEKKTTTWREMVDWMKKRDVKFKGKTEKIDHDLIAHGVSRDGS